MRKEKNVCRAIAFVGALTAVACGSSPAAPSSGTTSAPGGDPRQEVGKIIGRVFDVAHQPVSGAHVLIVSGSQAGAAAVTDADGAFSLSGGFTGPLVLSATASGYKTSTQGMNFPCGSCSDTALLNFVLLADVAVRFEPGEYTMTVNIDGACSDIPSSLRTRTYAATIGQPSNGMYYLLSIRGDYLQARTFGLLLWGDYVALDGEDPAVREELPDQTYLFWGGDGQAKVDTSKPLSAISIPFNWGAFDYCVLKSPLGPEGKCSTAPVDQVIARGRCTWPNGQSRLVLTRR